MNQTQIDKDIIQAQKEGDGMGICTACIIEDWCKGVSEE